jgi:hypothetical protein
MINHAFISVIFRDRHRIITKLHGIITELSMKVTVRSSFLSVFRDH